VHTRENESTLAKGDTMTDCYFRDLRRRVELLEAARPKSSGPWIRWFNGETDEVDMIMGPGYEWNRPEGYHGPPPDVP
jgi:hypothetical protein